MPIFKKIYPNCIWTVPPEWHGLNFYSVLLTKVYWNYATNIIRVCVIAISPATLKLNVKHKSNIQIRPGSKAMGSLYELFCHHSSQSPDPLLDELLTYLPTLFPSHIFTIPYLYYIVYASSNDETHHSDSNISVLHSDDSTYFS